MKVVCLADTHTLHENIIVPEGDLLIHAGDFCGSGTIQELLRFNVWLGTLPHQHKIVIAGNHDWPFQRDPSVRGFLTNAIYLQDSEVTVNGVRIYGSPWQPEFFNWAFNLKRGEELKRKWDQIPDGVDILVTHGPAYGVGDLLLSGEHVGCVDLLGAIERVKPRFHICGHIHSGYGSYALKDLGVTMINASNCDEEYRPINRPIVFECS
jgi:Icc-related predicted phosphoesterase